MKHFFGELRMTWLKVILLGFLAGIYTGAIMLVPVLEGTSFQDIGISYEWWVIFAVIIVVNCKSPREAMLKCFVFFLISQPLIYIVEIVSGSLAPKQGWYYYRAIWFPITLLTLPGGCIAYFCKKQNALGAVILGLGNTIQSIFALIYFVMATRQFPNHLLSAMICVGSVITMTICIQKECKNRIIALSLPIGLTSILPLLLIATGRVLF